MKGLDWARRTHSAVMMAFFTASACGPSPPPAVAPTGGETPEPGPLRAPAAESSLAGAKLALRSSGAALGTSWELSTSGYVASYIRLEQAGAIRVGVRASGTGDPSGAPKLRLTVADQQGSFEVGPEPSLQQLDVTLPPGTYLARVDFENGAPGSPRRLVVHELSVSGASLSPDHTDQNALDAANTFIHHFRRGPARIRLAGVSPGTGVKLSLVDHAFGFGANVPFAENKLIPESVAKGSDAERFQRLLLAQFNTVVLSNGGKWVYHEATRDRVEMAYVDRFLAFSAREGLRARMHTLIWDTEQQPAWIASRDPSSPGLLTRAHSGDLDAKRELAEEIDERIEYYVRERARGYQELDVLNESLHRPRYFQVFGVEGLAQIFARCAEAVRAAGADTRLYLNEYNLLQWSVDPLTTTAEPDPYANWYRWHAEAIMRAGGPISGLGVQYYADGRLPDAIGENAHSAARIMGVLQNLSGTELRLTLSEFAVNPGELPPERGADVLEETLRLVFGTPQADAFLIWAIWANAAQKPPPSSILMDGNDELTPAGRRYESLMKEWSTAVETPLAADGTLEFVGFYGDYSVEVGGQRRCFRLVKGQTDYVLAAPTGASSEPLEGGAQRCRKTSPTIRDPRPAQPG